MATPIPSNDATFDSADLKQALEALFASVPEGLHVTSVTTDSRRVTKGALFVALEGEQHDGHDHLEAALAKGAAAVLQRTNHPKALPSERAAARAISVHDTLIALGLLAHSHLMRWRSGARRVFQITGSSGKTTTKEMTAALLGLRARTLWTQGNLNNRIGLPHTALTVTDAHTYVVLEAGMSLPGEMAHLAAIGFADAAAIVNIGTAHAETAGGVEGVAREKGALFLGMRPNGFMVVNLDNAKCVAAAAIASKDGERTSITFGRHPEAQYRLRDRRVHITNKGTSTALAFARGDQEVTFDLPVPLFEHQAIDLMCALALAETAEPAFTNDELCKALTSLNLEGRGLGAQLGQDVFLFDDSYNANPDSMRASLAMLAEAASTRRKVAVLGEMKELGEAALEAHESLAKDVKAAGVELLLTCGGLASRLGAAATALGVPTQAFENARQAAEACVQLARTGDAILVKASRSVGSEVVCQRLREHFGEARA
jgi:UDP-N-acetylmuramoyl-tripeptide--D-alanyl-D-alanine ligase